MDDFQIYKYMGKSYEPIGKIEWERLKVGDVYANTNGVVYEVVSRTLPYHHKCGES